MSIKTIKSKDTDTLEIQIEGAFDFSLLSDFSDAYSNPINEETGKPFSNHIVNLRTTDSIDSSALGMLLNMKRTLDKKDYEIKISRCQPQIKKILLVLRFDKKFTID